MAKERRVFSSFQAAEYCQVSPFSVRNWIESEALPAYRTPGGHRRVLKEDLDAFLKKHGMPAGDILKDEKRRVLIVDDDSEVLKFVAEVVSEVRENVKIATASDGFEAGALLSEFKPHVVILDLKMPGLDGFQVCSRIKANPQTQDITVLGVTGYYSTAYAKRFAKCGGWQLLKKPFDVDILKEIVAEALNILRTRKPSRG